MKTRAFTRLHIHRRFAQGSSLLEVLVSIVIVALGLLGLAGLQAKMQVADLEAYQRTQAVLLLEEMVSRVMANKSSHTAYIPGSPNADSKITVGTAGTGVTNVCATTPTTRAGLDLCEWSNNLKGAAEVGGGNQLGAMIGARGCLQRAGAVRDAQRTQMIVTVTWQGNSPTAAPPAVETCAATLYNHANCPDDRCRRVVSATITTYNPLN